MHEKRGYEGINDNGVMPNFHGTAMHDRWGQYGKYDNVVRHEGDFLMGMQLPSS